MKTFAQTIGSLTNTKRHTLLGNKSLSFFSLPLSHTKRSIIYIWQHSYLEMYACVHVKLLQSCSTLRDPIDCSLPGSSVHGSPGKNAGVGCHALLQETFPTQRQNPHILSLPHWQAGSLPLVPPGKPLEMYTKLHI